MSTDIRYYFQNPEKFPFPALFSGINNTWEILPKAELLLNDLLVSANVADMRGELHPSAVLKGNYFIDEGTEIAEGVVINGPVYIGRNCEISPGAYIRPHSIISDNCSVGHGSEIKHSIMMEGAKVASLAFCGDSVLGVAARIGSGAITANRKFNQTNVSITDEGRRVDLGASFFGCILGDSSRLGANSVTQPGTHIGPYSWIYPLTSVRGFIARAKRVYNALDIVFEENEILDLS